MTNEYQNADMFQRAHDRAKYREQNTQHAETRRLCEDIGRLFQILESREESDSERIFSPTTISSCRAAISHELGTLMPRIKAAARANLAD